METIKYAFVFSLLALTSIRADEAASTTALVAVPVTCEELVAERTAAYRALLAAYTQGTDRVAFDNALAELLDAYTRCHSEVVDTVITVATLDVTPTLEDSVASQVGIAEGPLVNSAPQA